MTKLSYKLSYYVFYACIVIILVVLGLFYFVGYNNPVGDLNEPAHTETLIGLMYAMLAVCIIVTIGGSLIQFAGTLKSNPKSAVKSLIWLALFIVVLVVTYAIGSDAGIPLADGSVYDDKQWLKISDMMIYSEYLLFAIAAIATLLNLSGIFKK